MGKVDVAKAAVVSTSPGNEVIDSLAGALKAETAVDVKAAIRAAAAAAAVVVFMVVLLCYAVYLFCICMLCCVLSWSAAC